MNGLRRPADAGPAGNGTSAAARAANGAAPTTATTAAAAPRAGPKILVRRAGQGDSIAGAAPKQPKLTKEQEDSKKVAALLGGLGIVYCDGSIDVAAAVEAAGFAALQVGRRVVSVVARLLLCGRCVLGGAVCLCHSGSPRNGACTDCLPNTQPLALLNHAPSNPPCQGEGLIDKLVEATASQDPITREGALLALAQLPAAAGPACEPYLLPLVPLLLDRAADKHPPAREAAAATAAALAAGLTRRAVGVLLPVLFEHTAPLKRWQVREGALRMMEGVATSGPAEVAGKLPEIVPLVAEMMNDAREQVGVVRGCAGL
jgi:hypothetical protein